MRQPFVQLNHIPKKMYKVFAIFMQKLSSVYRVNKKVLSVRRLGRENGYFAVENWAYSQMSQYIGTFFLKTLSFFLSFVRVL